ncbi:hypothetical protein PR202_ga18807 [Eleusine coracana subsp. coracana]|uniref:Uncharacterized protein n=1 Tax=Eleusine coracana subsp. coracana TaxID=191504 RepID=A0AAV5CTV9_ELECO|nr:hypothetical protein QOZ80_4AG0301670 [Eleusine coracana subsp. coracana]GJN01533.1 hypothetical protein PR202_ga18807 [Eleusine coracana subsp. coracana]
MFTDGMSRLAVAVSVTVALSLAVFLTILVLLLADLFCAHLRRKRLRAAASSSGTTKLRGLSTTSPDDDASSVATTATTATTSKALGGAAPFYYAQGVMHAPNPKDLLLAIPRLESAVWKWSPARRSTPSRSASPAATSSPASFSADDASRFVYISNPVYELGGHQSQAQAAAPPFGITEDEEEEEEVGGGFSPPLSAMRKLPPLGVVACPPAALGFVDGRPSLTVTDPNRASSSSSNFTGHFFSPWSSK